MDISSSSQAQEDGDVSKEQVTERTYQFSVAVPGLDGTLTYKNITVVAQNIGEARHKLYNIVENLTGANQC